MQKQNPFIIEDNETVTMVSEKRYNSAISEARERAKNEGKVFITDAGVEDFRNGSKLKGFYAYETVSFIPDVDFDTNAIDGLCCGCNLPIRVIKLGSKDNPATVEAIENIRQKLKQESKGEKLYKSAVGLIEITKENIKNINLNLSSDYGPSIVDEFFTLNLGLARRTGKTVLISKLLDNKVFFKALVISSNPTMKSYLKECLGNKQSLSDNIFITSANLDPDLRGSNLVQCEAVIVDDASHFKKEHLNFIKSAIYHSYLLTGKMTFLILVG